MRLTLRSLYRRPAFSAAAILTVALGIGANTAVFRVIYGVLLERLPFREPSRLVQIWETHPALPQLQAAVPDFRDWQKQAHSFEGMASHTLAALGQVTLLGEGEPEVVHGANGTYDLFSTMGIQPILGRAFTAEEDRGKARVTLISEDLWRRKFGADPNIVGRRTRLGPESFTVIGVVSQPQTFPQWADLWIPFSLIDDQTQTRRKYHPLEVIARLKTGVSAAQAQTEMQSIMQRLAQTFPDTNGNESAQVIPLETQITGEVGPSLLLVWAAVGLVLLIACANLAHLLLARILERREELAIRSALGASAHHLVGLIFQESFVLAGVGGAIGFGIAVWTGQFLRKLAQDRIPRMEWTSLPAPVWLFAIAISAACGLVFALPTCWRILGDRRAAGRSVIRARSRFAAVLVAGEVALAFVVLTGALLLVRSFAALLDEKPGFDARGIVALDLSLPNPPGQAAPAFQTQVMPALRALPGVQQAAVTNAAPMSILPTEHTRWATRFGIPGRAWEQGQYPVAQMRFVSSDYFGLLGIPLTRGQWLTPADEGKPRCLINETLAKRFFPGQNPVGQSLVLGVMDARQNTIEIAGVVGDVREFGLEEEAAPGFYLAATAPGAVLLKTSSDPLLVDREVRIAAHAINADIVIRRTHRLQQNVDDSLARRRFAWILLAAFAGLAAILTAAGLYGLLAYSVNSRLREFGVRAAIGARPRELVSLVLREALLLTVPGLVAGTILSLSLTRVMRSVVYRLSPTDPLSIGSAAAFLILVTFLSGWLPARRAAAVDPAAALRAE